MTYNPGTDFVGLWRAVTGGLQKGEMPGLDFVVAALGRAGLINVTVSTTAPVASQSTTAWYQPASPSYSAEGVMRLWNGSAYVAATQALLLAMLQASAGQTGASLQTGNGAPGAGVGNNGDFYIRADSPGGLYGPKAAGAWPANPLPFTSYTQQSAALDTIGAVQGDIIYRNASQWVPLAPGANGNVLTSGGAGANPAWQAPAGLSSAAVDAAFGNTQGSILYRSAGAWVALNPGANGSVLQSGGAGANLAWTTTSKSFAAYQSAGSVTFSNGVTTKVQCDARTDPNNWYDNVTNFRFQPNIAGTYQISASVQAAAGTVLTQLFADIYVNGSTIARSLIAANGSSTLAGSTVTVIKQVALNGSTDFVELFANVSGTGTLSVSGGAAPIRTWFEATLLR